MGFLELPEACIKCLEKIVQENPPAVLKSGAIAVVMDQMGFFPMNTQKKIFKILLKIARHSSNENDFDQHLMPVLPFILMNLTDDTLINDLSKFEDASKIVFEMQESFVLFLSPTHDFKKVGLQYDKLSREGLFDIILGHVKQYCNDFTRRFAAKAKKLGNNQAFKDPLLRDLILDKQESEEGQIYSSIQGSTEAQIPHQMIQNYLKILENGCRYSINVSNKLFGQTTLIQDLGCFLPSEYSSSGSKHQFNADDFPFINDTINMLNSLLSDRAEPSQDKEENEDKEEKAKGEEHDDDGDSIMKGDAQTAEKDKVDEKEQQQEIETAIANLPPHLKRIVIQQEFQSKKREFQVSDDNKRHIVTLAEIVLPRVFYVYEIMINPQFRIRTLQLIDKIIALFDDELLQNFIKPQQFANFIYQIIRSKHIFSIEVCLRMTKKIIDCSPLNYSVPFIREGVSAMIEQLSDETKLKSFLGIRSDVDISEGQFDIEIHSLKEALHYQRINHPEDHHTRDFYERRLLELVDRQRHVQQLQAQEKAEAAKISALGQKLIKKSSNSSYNPFSSFQSNPDKQKVLPKIIVICKQLVKDYFQNKEFLQKLEDHSDTNKEQLNTFKELSDISQKLQIEAQKPLVNLKEAQNLQEIIQRFCNLLTLQDSAALTSHEFKESGLLYSLELLLTQTPTRAKYMIEKRRIEKENDGKIKHSDELTLNELESKTEGQITLDEGISVMNRLKLFIHVLLQKQKGVSPIDGLLELNHKVISENGSFITSTPGPQIDYSSYHGLGSLGGPSSVLRDNFSQGDYDHCISALKQLQKRVTVNLIYDPNKTFKDPNAAAMAQAAKDREKEKEKDQSSNPFLNPTSFIKSILEQEKSLKEKKESAKDGPAKSSDKDKPKETSEPLDKEAEKLSDQENSHMEDMSEVKKEIEEAQIVEKDDQVDKEQQNDQNKEQDKDEKISESKEAKEDLKIEKEDDQILSSATDLKDDILVMKKQQTHIPQSIKALAASPSKQQVILEIEKQNMNSSKVYMKRHFLYNEIQQIPVTVEQSSCLQILEDFLRNRIKSIEEVKVLKRDYGYGGMHSYKDPWSGAPPDLNSASPFDQALGGGQYQSITQKILRKNLGSEARKMLDQANNRLAKILNTGSGIKIAQRKRRSKKVKKSQPIDEEKMKDEIEIPSGDKTEIDQSKLKTESKIEQDAEDKKEVEKKETDKVDGNDKKELLLEKDKEQKSDRSHSKSYGAESNLDDDEASPSNSDDEDHQGSDDGYDDEEMMEEQDEFDEDREVVAASQSEQPGADDEEEKQKKLKQFVQDLPQEIINSKIPDDQQYMLVKILTRQHTFMMGYLEMNIQEGGGGPSEEEMYKFEQKLEDFQETMMDVQASFLSLKDEQNLKKKQKKSDDKKSNDTIDQNDQINEKDASQDDKQLQKKKSIQEILIQAKQSISKDKDSDQEMANEEAKPATNLDDKIESQQIQQKDDDKKESEENVTDKKENDEKQTNQKDQDLSHPQVKLNIKQNDAEMMKPAEVSDSENIEDSEVPKSKAKKEEEVKKEEESQKVKENEETTILLEAKDKIIENESDILQGMLPTLKKEDRTESEIVLEKKKEEQELLVQRALQKDRENLMRLRASIEERENGRSNRMLSAESAMNEQTMDIINQDLEKLIKEEGEDIEFEFFYEQKQIALNQTVFEITKNADTSKRSSEKAQVHAEQLRVLKEKEEELKSRARDIAAIKDKAKEKENEDKIAQLKTEYNMIREIQNQVQRQYDAESKGGEFSYFSGGHGPPPGFLSSFGHVHKIFFRIKEKNEDVATSLKRSRLDSLSDAAFQDLRRSRTKSEAVQDLSGASIKTFIEQLLFKEFKVFDKSNEKSDQKKEEEDDKKPSIDQKKLDEIKGKINIDTKFLTEENSKITDQRKAQEKVEKQILESSLKILKVVNFIYTNHDIISERGMKFVMEGYENQIANQSDVTMQSSLAPEPLIQMSDMSLQLGFAELQQNLFHNHKLDTYLQKSIKDPYSLVQGISSEMQQVFQNCPYLFPFQTKLLYFKLVSFISAIDVHRSIYFLRQYLRQYSGVNQRVKERDDNLKKITRQKVVINRKKILESGFQLIQKIDKRNFLEVSFEGEEGTGLGPTLEFYDSIAEELQKWKIDINDKVKDFSMWRTVGNGDLFPTPICLKSFDQSKIKQIYEMYRLTGTLIAKAIVDDRQIDMPISHIFWKICLGQQMSIFDYQQLETSDDGNTVNQEKFHMLADFQILFNQQKNIEQDFVQDKIDEDEKKKRLENLKTSRGMKVEDYFMTFTLPEPYSYIELIQKGSQMDVTLESAQDYVDLVLHYTFHESIKIQVQAFKKGFNSIFPISSLQPFVHASSKGDEIQQIVCGQPCQGPEWTNPEELMKYIEPDHGYTKKSEPYQFFIRYITELQPSERTGFLKFLTGSKRLPLGGFRNLQPNLTFVKKAQGIEQGVVERDINLPSCNTCFNYVKCPPYTSYEVLKSKFDQAFAYGQGNFSFS